MKYMNYRCIDRALFRIKYISLRWIFRKRTICLSFSVVVLILLFTAYSALLTYNNCSFIEVENAVMTICDKYQNREALGNLCVDLCELNNLKPNNCLPNHLGKDVVFEATFFDKHVVMKSSKLNSEDFDQVYYTDVDGNKVHPSIDSFYSMITNTIQSELNIFYSSKMNNDSLNLLTKIWTKNMNNFFHLPPAMQNVAMNNIWFLVQQTEYLFMKYFEDMNVFPKIRGTCGPFYVVEFIRPLDNYFLMFYPSWKQDFLKRANLALKLLNFLEETELRFPFLHFCDVKVGHFGLDENYDIRLLDMDMVFFENGLIKNIVAIQNCSNNQDCSFIDCLGTCNSPKKECKAEVLDNNFLRVCRNILAGKLMPSYFGLLSSPPPSIHNKLYSILQQCSETLDDKSSHIVASQLKHLLVSVVDGDIDL